MIIKRLAYFMGYIKYVTGINIYKILAVNLQSINL